MTATTDRRPDLYRAFENAAGIAEGIQESQMAGPTPCTKYDVAELLGHTVMAAHRTSAIGRGEPADAWRLGAGIDDLTEVADELRRAGKEAVEAWSDDSRLNMEVKMPWGEVYPGSVLVDMYLTELATHAWDLAAATGQLERLDPSLAGPVLAAATGMLKPEYRNDEGSPFGPEVEAPEGASTWERVAAFMGRQPR